jgi:hypothetical protein
VSVDPRANFAQFHTFAIGKGTVDSRRPELDNRLFVKMLGDAIRDGLVAKGLKEAAHDPDLVATFSVAGDDITSSAPGLMRGQGPRPVRFTQGTVVIDLSRSGDPAPVWRGTYEDEESTGSKLVAKLPDDAKKLLARLPHPSSFVGLTR